LTAVITFPLMHTTVEIVIFSTKNWTINNSINFHNFPTKLCAVIASFPANVV